MVHHLSVLRVTGRQVDAPERETKMTDQWSCPHCREKDALIAELKAQLAIETDLADHRWKALNDIYENSEKHNANWCKRKAAEGLHLKK